MVVGLKCNEGSAVLRRCKFSQMDQALFAHVFGYERVEEVKEQEHLNLSANRSHSFDISVLFFFPSAPCLCVCAPWQFVWGSWGNSCRLLP